MMWTLILFVLGWVFVISWLDARLARAGIPPFLTPIYYIGGAVLLTTTDESTRHAIGDEMRAVSHHINALVYSSAPMEQMQGLGIFALAGLLLLFPIMRDIAGG
jgi:hypothetical protein